jgi:hypothetical protein
MQRIIDVGRLPGMAEQVLGGRFALLDRLGSGGMLSTNQYSDASRPHSTAAPAIPSVATC